MQLELANVIKLLGRTDVYLLDQIIKGRYQNGDTILDAGCGHGRNIDLFIKCGIDVTGVDNDFTKIDYCQNKYPSRSNRFSKQGLQNLDFENDSFDHIISSAVMHFAKSFDQFKEMFSEQVRVLKPRGTIFIRMTSLFGVPAENVTHLEHGVYEIQNYGTYFLLTYAHIQELLGTFNLSLAEPVKAVNVQDNRAMAVIVFQKN